MKLSEAIDLLVRMKATYGDLDLAVKDADTGWLLEITPDDFEKDGDTIRISSGYPV